MHSVVVRRGVTIPAVILCMALALHVLALEYGHHIHNDGDMAIRLSILILPLPAAVFCVLAARHYGYSRVFGRSFMVLGASYALVFVGELVFFYFVDTLDLYWFASAGEVLFLCAYVFLAAHMIINVRYFAGQLTALQKVAPFAVSASVVAVYCMVFVAYGGAITDQFYYNLVFVAVSSAILGLCIVALCVFAKTAMTTAWVALLGGIAAGTVGDLSYNYAYALGTYGFGDVSGPLWGASHVIVVYALYLHQRCI